MDPYIGEVRMFGGSFAPVGWAMCDGSLLSIANNEALFSLLGTTYGGDGQTTFGLPDLRGRVPLHPGSGVSLGQVAGDEAVTLTPNNFPAHSHTFAASASQGQTNDPKGNVVAEVAAVNVYVKDDPSTSLNGATIGPSVANGMPYGSDGPFPHDNMQPFLCVTFIIALEGIYPPRD